MFDVAPNTIKGYELREELGKGSYGTVFRAYQPLVARDVAIKVIHRSYANQPVFIRRFEAEAHLVARLEHPHIVPLYDYWRDPDGAFLVMRWLRTGSLRGAINGGPLPLDRVMRMFEQIGAALTVAHRHGVIHRDIKPDNILLDEDDNSYLADFGIAKDLTDPASYETTTQIVGSPAYLSPEQIGRKLITPQTDIYSLGILLFEVLTGQIPFPNLPVLAQLYKHVHEPVPSIRQLHATLPGALDRVIQRATAKAPQDRYPNVLSLVHDMRRVLQWSQVTVQLPAVNGNATRPGNGHEQAPTANARYDTVILHEPEIQQIPAPPLENPYKGLRAFQEADAADFFGREALAQRLLARLAESGPMSRFLAVVGPSGSGKSSVVRAGLLPALRRGSLPISRHWFVVEMFPGADPLGELRNALLRVAVDQPADLETQLRADVDGLKRVVKRILPAPGTELLLVIDQFEELFTRVEDERARAHLLDSLVAALSDPSSQLRVIVTLRADFYDRPLAYPGFSEFMRERTEVVVPLTPDELRAAIVLPAERAGLAIDPGLVDAIVYDVGSQPGMLPLLQYALTELFEHRSGHTLTLTTYQQTGGVASALARRAEETFANLDTSGRQAVQQLFLRLVTLGEGTEDTRRRVRRSELATAAGAGHTLSDVIDLYSHYRLLTLDRDPVTREPTIEVAHEALIRTWDRLRQWLTASRDDLRLHRKLGAAAQEWTAAGRDPSFLASGGRLEQFAVWAETTSLALNEVEQAYLTTSLNERNARRSREAARQARELALEQRSTRALRLLTRGALLAAVIAVGLATIAWIQRENAKAQEDQARHQAIASGAQAALYRGNRDLALQLAMAGSMQSNPLPLMELSLAEAAYAPGTRRVFRGHRDTVNAVALSPDGKTLLSGSKDGTMLLWDFATAAPLRTFQGHKEAIRQVRYVDEGRALTASEDGNLILWDISSGQPIGSSWQGHTTEVKGLAISPDGTRALSGSADRTLILWDINRAEPIGKPWLGHDDEINIVAFSPDGTLALSASQDTAVILWDVATGTIRHRLCCHLKEARGVAFSPDGKLAASSSDDNTLILWDLEEGRRANIFRGHTDAVYDVAFSPDGTLLASGSVDNTVRLWDAASGNQLGASLMGHRGGIRDVEFTADGHTLLSASLDRTIRLWDLEHGALLHNLQLENNGVIKTAVFNTDGRLIFDAAEDHSSRVWDAQTGQLVRRDQFHSGPVEAIALSPDGKYVLSGGGDNDGFIVVSEAATGAFVRRFQEATHGMNTILLSQDGKRAFSSSKSVDTSEKDASLLPYSLIMWDVTTGERLSTFGDFIDGVHSMALHPDGRTLLTAIGNDVVEWDVETGRKKRTFENGHPARVNMVAYSPDGKFALSASQGEQRQIILWSLPSATPTPFETQAGEVSAIAFSPDGKLALSASSNTLTVWDIERQQPIRTYTGHKQRINSVAFSPDGQRILSTSSDASVRLWRFDSLPDLQTWTSQNRSVPVLTCAQTTIYHLEGSCSNENEGLVK